MKNIKPHQKPASHTLTLSRESLRRLDQADLVVVVGGRMPPSEFTVISDCLHCR
jgi:hypothetical protein